MREKTCSFLNSHTEVLNTKSPRVAKGLKTWLWDFGGSKLLKNPRKAL